MSMLICLCPRTFRESREVGGGARFEGGCEYEEKRAVLVEALTKSQEMGEGGGRAKDRLYAHACVK